MAATLSVELAESEPEWAVTTEKIVQAVEQIVAIARPVEVIAFGSRARGDHRTDSDLDLAVIVDRYYPAKDKRPLWRADIDVWMNMDVLVYDTARDRLMVDMPVSLQHEVRRYGITLYERGKNVINRTAAARLV